MREKKVNNSVKKEKKRNKKFIKRKKQNNFKIIKMFAREKSDYGRMLRQLGIMCTVNEWCRQEHCSVIKQSN